MYTYIYIHSCIYIMCEIIQVLLACLHSGGDGGHELRRGESDDPMHAIKNALSCLISP